MRSMGVALDRNRIWQAALADSGLSPEECRLVVLDEPQSGEGEGAKHFAPDLAIEAGQLGADHVDLEEELNTPSMLNIHRIIAWKTSGAEAFAGPVRHELEHATQVCHFGTRMNELHGLAFEVLKFGAVTPSGAITKLPSYNDMPMEQDANAAASLFVRNYFGADRIDALLEQRDPHAALFRVRVGGPEPLETLPPRMLLFLSGIATVCEQYAANLGPTAGLSFRQLLDVDWPELGTKWVP
jgi:hypothetical protein